MTVSFAGTSKIPLCDLIQIEAVKSWLLIKAAIILKVSSDDLTVVSLGKNSIAFRRGHQTIGYCDEKNNHVRMTDNGISGSMYVIPSLRQNRPGRVDLNFSLTGSESIFKSFINALMSALGGFKWKTQY